MLELWGTLLIAGLLGVIAAGIVTLVNYVAGVAVLVRMLQLFGTTSKECRLPGVQLVIHVGEMFITTGFVLLLTEGSPTMAILSRSVSVWLLIAPMAVLFLPLTHLFLAPREFKKFYIQLLLWALVRLTSVLAVWATAYEMVSRERHFAFEGHIAWVWLLAALLSLTNLHWVEQQRKALISMSSMRFTTASSESTNTSYGRSSDIGWMSRKTTAAILCLLVGVLGTLEGTKSF